MDELRNVPENKVFLTFDPAAHISFDTPPKAITEDPYYYYNPNDEKLPTEDREKVIRAFKEIASTPEGSDLIQKAFLKESGHINVVHSPNGHVLAIAPDTILLGTFDKNIKYLGKEGDEKYYDTSLQRVLVHELQHLALKHGGVPKGENNPENEQEAIRNTNIFMKKYYNEPEGVETHDAYNRRGTKQWDLNLNFKPDGYDLETNPTHKNTYTPPSSAISP